MKVFLGGTCAGSKWREELIPMLKINYFNPVVPDWTEECYQEELRQREICDLILYVITPKMKGAYSVAEVVDDSNKRPEKTIFCLLKTDEHKRFTKGEWMSLARVKRMVDDNGAYTCTNLEEVAYLVNSAFYWGGKVNV